MLSSNSFMTLAVIFRSLFHFVQFFCVLHETGIQLHSQSCGSPVFLATAAEEILLSLFNGFVTLVKKISWPQMYGFISGLSILFHWSLCYFILSCLWLLYRINVEIEKCESSNFASLFKYYFSYLKSLAILFEFEIGFPISARRLGNLIEIIFNL